MWHVPTLPPTHPLTHRHALLPCPHWTFVFPYGVTVAGAAGQLWRGGAGAAWAGGRAGGSVVPGGCPAGHSGGGGGAAGWGPKRSWTGLFGMFNGEKKQLFLINIVVFTTSILAQQIWATVETLQSNLIYVCLQSNCWIFLPVNTKWFFSMYF